MRLKIVLMLVEMPGSSAPAATAIKPARSAYSTRSWPRLSRAIFEKYKQSFVISLLPASLPTANSVFSAPQPARAPAPAPAGTAPGGASSGGGFLRRPRAGGGDEQTLVQSPETAAHRSPRGEQ